jgi:hypothetical protein
VNRASFVTLLILAACDTRQSMEARLRFELTRSEAHIDEAQRISAAGGDPTFPCTAVRQTIAGLADERVQTVNATVERGRAVCREVTLKFADALVARLGSKDVARKARDCVDLARSIALVTAIAAKANEPRAAELEKKRKILCP